MAMQINSGMSGSYGITTLPSRPEFSPEAKDKVQNAALDTQAANVASEDAQATAVRTAAVGMAAVNQQQAVVERYVEAGSDQEVDSGSSVSLNNAMDLQQKQDLAQKAELCQQAQAAKSPLEQKLASMMGDNRPQSSVSIQV